MVYEPNFELKFRPHKGQTIEQIGLKDYAYLSCLGNPSSRLANILHRRRFDQCNGPDSIKYVLFLLNNYQSGRRCTEEHCDTQASHLTLRGGEVSTLSSIYTYCHDHALQRTDFEPWVSIHPIAHKTIKSFSYSGARREAQDFFNKVAGYEGRNTKANARSFIDSLIGVIGVSFEDHDHAWKLANAFRKKKVLEHDLDSIYVSSREKMKTEVALEILTEKIGVNLDSASDEVLAFLAKRFGSEALGGYSPGQYESTVDRIMDESSDNPKPGEKWIQLDLFA